MFKVTVAVKPSKEPVLFIVGSYAFILHVTGFCKVGETRCTDEKHTNYMKCLSDSDADCVPDEQVMYIACMYMYS